MLKSRRHNASQALQETNVVNRWIQHPSPVTTIFPNGNEKEFKGSLHKTTRVRQQKRSRGQMANMREFRTNKAADYGDVPSEKYNYGAKENNPQSNSDLPDSVGSDDEDDEDDDDDVDKDDDEEDEDEKEGKIYKTLDQTIYIEFLCRFAPLFFQGINY